MTTEARVAPDERIIKGIAAAAGRPVDEVRSAVIAAIEHDIGLYLFIADVKRLSSAPVLAMMAIEVASTMVVMPEVLAGVVSGENPATRESTALMLETVSTCRMAAEAIIALSDQIAAVGKDALAAIDEGEIPS